MSRKRKTSGAEFKTKCVLELLEGDKTLNKEQANTPYYPKACSSEKKQFLEDAYLVFGRSVIVYEYKDEIEQLSKEKDRIAKKLGEVIVERG